MRYWSAAHTPLRNDDGGVFAVMQHHYRRHRVHRLQDEDDQD